MKPNLGMRSIEYLCWAFFGLCAVGVGRGVILKLVAILDWGLPDWAAWVQAIGSIAAIFGAFLISAEQAKQQRLTERRQAAEERLRIAIFSDGVVEQSLITLKNLMNSIEKWPDGKGFIYHEIERIDAAIQTLRILMAQPLPADVIKAVLLTHATLLESDASAKGLIGQGPASYKNNPGHVKFWSAIFDQITTIQTQIAIAFAFAGLDPDLALTA